MSTIIWLLYLYLTLLVFGGIFGIVAWLYMACAEGWAQEKEMRAIYKAKADARRAAGKAKADANRAVRRDRNRQMDLADGWLVT